MILPFEYTVCLKNHSKVIGFCFLAAQETFIMGKKPSYLVLFKRNGKKKDQALLDKERFVSDHEMNGIHVSIQMAALC